MARQAGVKAFTLGTMQPRVGESCNVPLRHTATEAQTGLTGPGPVSVKVVNGYIEIEIYTSDYTIAQLTAGGWKVAQVDFRNGKSYVLTDPDLIGEPESVDGATDKVTIRLEGPGRWVE